MTDEQHREKVEQFLDHTHTRGGDVKYPELPYFSDSIDRALSEEQVEELRRWARSYADAACALRGAQKESGWRPIETAPKDEPILVGPTKRMDICVAMNHSRDGWVTETCSEWVSIYTPTHWMPLPEPPNA